VSANGDLHRAAFDTIGGDHETRQLRRREIGPRRGQSWVEGAI
jgi:hypothetical protein